MVGLEKLAAEMKSAAEMKRERRRIRVGERVPSIHLTQKIKNIKRNIEDREEGDRHVS